MEIPTNRYDKWHSYGEVCFYLSDYDIDSEQARYLLFKVIEQSIRDYISLVDSSIPSEQQFWETARGFLFDDEYRIEWGNININAEEALDILDLNLDWVRGEVLRKYKEKHGNNYKREEKESS